MKTNRRDGFLAPEIRFAGTTLAPKAQPSNAAAVSAMVNALIAETLAAKAARS